MSRVKVKGEVSHPHAGVAKRKELSSVSALSQPAWKDGERNKQRELQMGWDWLKWRRIGMNAMRR